MLIQVNKSEVKSADEEKLADLRRSFEENRCMVLPNFIDKSMLTFIQSKIRLANPILLDNAFKPGKSKVAGEMSIRDQSVLTLCTMLFNRIELFELLRQVTGCSQIGSCRTRVYKITSDHDHHFPWHQDLEKGNRLLGVSVNLGEAPFDGGKFQLREKQSKKMLFQVDQPQPGSAHVFQISPELEHCVTAVTGSAPKIACAGWFVSSPQYSELMKGLIKRKGNKLIG